MPESGLDVRFTHGLLARRRAVIEATTLADIDGKNRETGRIENFSRVARGESGTHEGLLFNDSDVYKWLEACAYFELSPALSASCAEVIGLIADAQEEDGYLNTFFQLQYPNLKWRNLGMMHEMYCLGHLLEAAAAWKSARGDERLTAICEKVLGYVERRFAEKPVFDGHEEFELALQRLADAYPEWSERCLKLAEAMVELRGTRPSPLQAELDDEEATALSRHGRGLLEREGVYNGEYAQDHAPIREHTSVVGHAVRAMYLYIAAARIARDKGDHALRTTLENLYAGMVTKRMYVTGGIGPSAANEGFTVDYDLPNLSAYAETCASAGLMMWSRAMNDLTGDSAYADTLERALFNGFLSGISAEGDRYFYDNPLESRGKHERSAWFGCACCPSNVARTMGRLGDYVASGSATHLTLHIPFGGEIRGVAGEWRVQTEYPSDGRLELRYTGSQPRQMALRVRIPDWADEVGIELPGDDEAVYDRGYAVCERLWRPGDVARFEFEMPVRFLVSDPRVLDNVGRVAVARGPVVYAAISPTSVSKNAADAPQLFALDPSQEPAVSGDAITVYGSREAAQPLDELYMSLDDVGHEEPAELTLRPYFTWADEGPAYMQVWLRRQ